MLDGPDLVDTLLTEPRQRLCLDGHLAEPSRRSDRDCVPGSGLDPGLVGVRSLEDLCHVALVVARPELADPEPSGNDEDRRDGRGRDADPPARRSSPLDRADLRRGLRLLVRGSQDPRLERARRRFRLALAHPGGGLTELAYLLAARRAVPEVHAKVLGLLVAQRV